MPTALPGISIGQATQLLQQQDQVLRSFPEVASVFGSIGRSDSATDNAPLDMYDTTVTLKPRGEWRPGMTYEKLISEMDAKLQFPGLTNTWTMPIENRLDMELTGIKTPVGIKIQGPNLEGIEELGARVQQILGAMPEMRSVFAERVAQGFYINVDVNRAEAARYGLTVGDVQRAITSGIGGENIAENIEGRERYPISVRYALDFRDDIQKLERVVIATPSNAQVPLGELAKISFSKGPAMIRDEDAALTGYVYLDLNTRDYGGFVSRADKLLRQKLQLPAGYSLKWSGEYEFELRAKERLKIMLPGRLRCDFSAAVYGVPIRDRSTHSDLSDALCDDGRPSSPVVPWLQFQRCGLGWLHRVVRNRGRDWRRDGRLFARSTRPEACRRICLAARRY